MVARRGLNVVLLVGVCCIFFLLQDEKDAATVPKQVDKSSRRFLKTQKQGEEIPFFYDVLNCPAEPPLDYPQGWNVGDVLDDWNADDLMIPSEGTNPDDEGGLCTFDGAMQREESATYRDRELPFVLKNHPDILQASTFGLIRDPVNEVMRMSHFSERHFLASRESSLFDARLDRWSFLRWKSHHGNHYRFLYDEEQQPPPLLDQQEEDGFFTDPAIQCRPARAGSTSPFHFDSHPNWIAVLQGKLRLLLAPPHQCPAITASFDETRQKGIPMILAMNATAFRQVKVTQVVLEAGDVLSLPPFWFRREISLERTFHCNAAPSGEGGKTSTEHRRPSIMDACARMHAG